MKVKENLNKIRHIDMMIDCKCSQIKDLRDRLTSISCPMGEKVQSTKDPDKFTDPVSKIIELEQEINEDIDKLIDLKRIARKVIEQLDNDFIKNIIVDLSINDEEEKAVSAARSARIMQLNQDLNNKVIKLIS